MFRLEEIKSLNDLELEVYNYVMMYGRRVLHMKIRELADETHVSTATVLRFCRKQNCEGYSEFKLKLKEYLEAAKPAMPDVDVAAIMNYFKKVDSREFWEKMDRAIAHIMASAQVIFVGVGTSGILGKYGARYLSSSGKFSQYIDDPFYPVYIDFFKGATVIALSVTGETRQTIEMVNVFKGRQSYIISMTNSENCTLARLSDLNFSYYMPNVTGIQDTLNLTTQVPVIYMIETIGRRLLNAKCPENTETEAERGG